MCLRPGLGATARRRATAATSSDGPGCFSLGLRTSASQMTALATSPDCQGRTSPGLGASAGQSAASVGVRARWPSVPSRLLVSVAASARDQRPGVPSRLPGNGSPRGP
eukprot:2240813-Pyramimonas_sp.AAC.1